jgi:hypothetical protein
MTKAKVEELSQSAIWKTLRSVDCSSIEYEKGNLTYIGWADLWVKLMDIFPQSSYIFDEPIFYGEGDNKTCEVACAVYIGQYERSINLPVMTSQLPMKSIKNPTSRDINDARMRALVKCIGMHGLGLYLWCKRDNSAPKKNVKQMKPRELVNLAEEIGF